MTATIAGLLACLVVGAPQARGVSPFYMVTRVGGSRIAVRGVMVDLTQARVRVALAWDHVGRTETLRNLCKRQGAVAGINGCFFDAYSSRPYRNPVNTILLNGQVVYRGDVGTLLGFDQDFVPYLGRVECHVTGELNDSSGDPSPWYAYWINHYPTGATAVTIFDRWWGTRAPNVSGLYAVVNHGTVRTLSTRRPYIPDDGFAVYFKGDEKSLGYREFREGRECSYHVNMTGDLPKSVIGDLREGLAAGPRLLAGGKAALHARAEGFTDPRILRQSRVRSAVGYSADKRTMALFVTSRCTMGQLVHVARTVGCAEALNLDGGGSSGLWYDGRYIARPERSVPNALIVLPRDDIAAMDGQMPLRLAGRPAGY